MFYCVFDHKEKPNLDGLGAVGNSELRNEVLTNGTILF